MNVSCSLTYVLMVSVTMGMVCLDVTVSQDSSQTLQVAIVQVCRLALCLHFNDSHNTFP